jgi:hypothetical protein
MKDDIKLIESRSVPPSIEEFKKMLDGIDMDEVRRHNKQYPTVDYLNIIGSPPRYDDPKITDICKHLGELSRDMNSTIHSHKENKMKEFTDYPVGAEVKAIHDHTLSGKIIDSNTSLNIISIKWKGFDRAINYELITAVAYLYVDKKTQPDANNE